MHAPCPGKEPEKEKKTMERTKRNYQELNPELRKAVRAAKKTTNRVIPLFVTDEKKALTEIREKDVENFKGEVNIDTNLKNFYEVRTHSVKKNGMEEEQLSEQEVSDARDLSSYLMTTPTYERVEPKGIRTSVKKARRDDVIYIRSKKKACYKKNYHHMEPQYHLKTTVHCRFSAKRFSRWSAENDNLSMSALLDTRSHEKIAEAANASLWSIAYSNDPENILLKNKLQGAARDALVFSEFTRWLSIPRVVKN